MSEGQDSSDIVACRINKTTLVAAVVKAANPKTIVVLETGGPVTMPWVGKSEGDCIESWYPGIGGGEAIANVLVWEGESFGQAAGDVYGE